MCQFYQSSLIFQDIQRQAYYDSIYGSNKDSWRGWKGLLKISLLVLLGLVALLGVLAYTNPNWEVWNGLFEEKPVISFSHTGQTFPLGKNCYPDLNMLIVQLL